MRRRRPAKAVTAVSTTDVATSVTESCGETSLSMHYLPALHCCMCLSSPLIRSMRRTCASRASPSVPSYARNGSYPPRDTKLPQVPLVRTYALDHIPESRVPTQRVEYRVDLNQHDNSGGFFNSLVQPPKGGIRLT